MPRNKELARACSRKHYHAHRDEILAKAREYYHANVEGARKYQHASGMVRGMLCGNCNRGIGLLKHSPAILGAAAAYVGVT
jgi:hypothetical protein